MGRARSLNTHLQLHAYHTYQQDRVSDRAVALALKTIVRALYRLNLLIFLVFRREKREKAVEIEKTEETESKGMTETKRDVRDQEGNWGRKNNVANVKWHLKDVYQHCFYVQRNWC